MVSQFIGVDCDEVLAELVNSYLEFNRNEYGEKLNKEDIFSYNLWEVFNISKEDSYKRIEEFFNSPYFENINTVEDSLESTKFLSKKNNLVVITSRPLLTKDKTREWIEKRFIDTFEEIHHTGEYSQLNFKNINGKTRKVGVCKKLGVDILIEDSLKNAIDCSSVVSRVFLIDYPWNQLENLPLNVTRVRNWRSIISRLK